ncbi:MAG TPA: hypothetical protein VGS62_08555 [Streptosporangiaceae bacterium]|nr:hypothetical protein [Streptosporangiaceae bacterium]
MTVLLPAGSLASVAAIPSSTCVPGTVPGYLAGVAATSSSSAWAAGDYSTSTAVQTLIEHWNGTAWCTVASPDPGGSSETNRLQGVAAVSSSSAWAVGSYGTSTRSHTLIEHWNGTAWNKQASPNPTGFSRGSLLSGVAAASSSNAWAVGASSHGFTSSRTLIAHWDGTAWTQVPSPNPGGTGSSSQNVLLSVAATSSSNAWAAGFYSTGTGARSLVLHWNGTAWTQQTSLNQGELESVAAISPASAWAAGSLGGNPASKTLVEHWNGTAWSQQASPNPAGFSFGSQLAGVAATSSSNAWAVGQSLKDIGPTVAQTLIARWNGTAWAQVSSPNPGGSAGDNLLGSVYALSSSSAWAVGGYATSPTASGHTLVVHWNGTAWTQQPSP